MMAEASSRYHGSASEMTHAIPCESAPVMLSTLKMQLQ